MSPPFVPRSPGFIKKSAKQLQHAFPGLSPSVCHEAVARALGYRDWFECRSRLLANQHPPSAPDEEVTAEVRLARRVQQVAGLVDGTGLPSAEIENFARRWRLTARAPGELGEFSTTYAALEKELADDGPNAPVRLADGVLVTRVGRPFYALSVARTLAVPSYLRGNGSGYSVDECCLWPGLPDVFTPAEEEAQTEYLRLWQPWRYEWLLNTPRSDGRQPSLRELGAASMHEDEQWFALSIRSNMRYGNDRALYAPALRGAAFGMFLRSKGRVPRNQLQWFRFTDRWADTETRRNAALRGPAGQGKELLTDAVIDPRLPRNAIQPVPPLYATPFKHGPMFEMEYMPDIENGTWPLAEEVSND